MQIHGVASVAQASDACGSFLDLQAALKTDMTTAYKA